MLTTTTVGVSQSTKCATDTEHATTITTTAGTTSNSTEAIEDLKSLKVQIKTEVLSILSPDTTSNQLRTMADEIGGAIKNHNSKTLNTNNNNNINSTTTSASSNPAETAAGGSAATGGTVASRHSSANSSSVNSSPKALSLNNCDHSNTNTNSNSSNISSCLTQIVDTDSHQDELLIKKTTNIVKEENGAKLTTTSAQQMSTMEKVSLNSGGAGGTTNSSGSNNGSSGNQIVSVTTVKEEPSDIIGSLVHMKKEEQFSPNMSPVGFGSIAPSANTAIDQSETSVKIELPANNGEKHVSASALGLNSDDIVACNPTLVDAERLSETSATHPNSSGAAGSGSGPLPLPPGPGQGALSLTNFLTNNNNVGGTCLDYMQQQNHIFVFSTQLANKGAEAVLSGQYQTIIAYHCTQPATKTFLEDFFIKNPMKMNKLQRQNSLSGLGIFNMPGVQNSWAQNSSGSANMNSNANANASLAKILQPPSQKLGGLKNLFNSPTDNTNKGNNNFAADPTSGDALVNESEIMCWDTDNRNNLDGSSQPSESQSLKLMEGIEGVGTVGSGLGKCSNNELSLSVDNNIISLQGVKVPDENLTPQQRQHREEQLAKIKKMNQFLFPENDKIQNDSAMANLMMNMQHGNPSQQIRQQMHQKSEHIQLGTEDVLMPMTMPLPADVIGDIGTVVTCSQKNNLSCGGVASSSPVATPGGAGVNSLTQNTNMLTTNSPDMVASFGNSNCHNIMNVGSVGLGVTVGDKVDGLTLPQAGNQMTQLEWNKMQQHFFEDRLKVGKATASRPSGLGPVPGAGTVNVQQPPSSGSSTASISNSSNQSIRNNIVQGPPPPYHPTQRSASVPIATQSPNPSSPNNLSLPSPRTSGGTLGLPTNSPIMDLPALNSSSTGTVSSSAASAPKSCFQSGGESPSSSRNRGAINHLNSNPTTPLSHISPKELESFNPTTNSVDSKTTRPSPQRTRSPSNAVTNVNSGGNHQVEQTNMDVRFPSSSPGLNFNAQLGQHLQGSPSNVMNAFKGPNNPLEINRQNCGPPMPQFSRRSDNMPLNPNSASNRSAPNAKISQSFDPISSLAQMSQQLTSCVPGGVGGSPAGGINMLGTPDVNMEHSGMMSAVALIDATEMDHMNHNTNSNTCHSANTVLNPVMGQRMLNPKMCGFNTNAGPGPVSNNSSGSLTMAGPGFHGILPAGATRMMGRMPHVNFGPNFNANIQVKASTPNTIQYMPVRPHNNNNNNSGNGNGSGSNVRVPPSLEFLQRYANPQMAGGPPIGHGIGNDVGPIMIGPGSGSMNVSSSNEQQQQIHQQQQQQQGNNKILNSPNNSNGIGMNFFQNCNQLPGLDDEVGAAVVSGGQTSMIRGMRPQGGMRQHTHGMMARMQAPSSRQQVQFAGINPDGLECNNDPAAVLFNNSSNAAALFAANQHQQQQGQCKQLPSHQKPVMPSGLCANVGMQGGPPAGQGQNHSHPVMGAPNSGNLMSTAAGNGVGGVNFVGPSSNDLKYAQQYHSFQQQLYATNTRSQQQIGGVGGGNMITMPPNLSPNPTFFVSK
ncbi:protein BCL9 homolog [Drosophila albomicans]|uniref:Protein BCL9 homolog n=1 Tax=Drosophila albomicans TaxID=7291 RepID=A0A6P8XGY1_DROAB|nr:protein BCL9 homolog [Drosophila albomicans]